MKLKSIIASTVLLCPLSFSVIASENTISLVPWVESVNYSYSIDSSKVSDKYGSPTSELFYKKMKRNGLSLKFDNESDRTYNHVELSYSKGSSDGTMIDNDYFSRKYVGPDNPTRFLSTLSNANMEQGYEIKLERGYVYHPNNFMMDKFKLGMSLSYSMDKFQSKGLDVLEDPYKNYTNSVGAYSDSEVMIKNEMQKFQLGYTGAISKSVSTNLSLDAKLTVIAMSLIKNKDSHLKRSDLGSPSLIFQSNNYGFDSEISLNYKINSLILTAGAKYMYMTPYRNGTGEVFNKDNQSIGGTPLTDHTFSSTRIFTGIKYIF